MSTLGEFICKVFEKVTETELSGRSCFSLFGEVELPEMPERRVLEGRLRT